MTFTVGHGPQAPRLQRPVRRVYQGFCVMGRLYLIASPDAEAVAEHDGKLRHSGGSFALGILSVVADTAQDQIQQFDRDLVGREVPAIRMSLTSRLRGPLKIRSQNLAPLFGSIHSPRMCLRPSGVDAQCKAGRLVARPSRGPDPDGVEEHQQRLQQP